MLITMLFIGAVIIIEAWPTYRIFAAQTFGGRISLSGWLLIAVSFILVLAINILATFLPSEDRLETS
jgi:hypothetical protein